MHYRILVLLGLAALAGCAEMPTETPPDPAVAETSAAPQAGGESNDAAEALAQGMALYQAGQFVEALPHLQRAAESDHVDAQYLLGQMHYKGNGLEKSHPRAAEWYRRAALQGHARAQFELGWMQEHGEGMVRDQKEAVAWYEKAAQQGVSNAQYNLAVMYSKGEGVAQDFAQAAHWYEQSAEQGNVLAQYNLGVVYYSGKGVKQDAALAAHWTQKAAEQGFVQAQYNLGVMYQQGKGVPRDKLEAYVWFSIAASQDDANAAKARDALDKYLSRKELTEGRRRVADFAAKQTPPQAGDSPPVEGSPF